MLHHKLTALKEKTHLTNQQIADRSGVPLSSVTRMMSGQTDNPSYRHVADIVVAMGGSLDELEGIQHPTEKTPDKVIEMYDNEIKTKDKWIRRLAIACTVLTSAFVLVLAADVLIGSIGFIRY